MRKRMILFQFHQYGALEEKLEKMAAKGLFLEKVGSMFWTFKKGEPKALKYTVAYFSEGSMFNPSVTENQETYYEYAKASGWELVTEFNQMQIFSSEEKNPIPFETDEGEKLENIKRCMRKQFLPATIALILIFLMNLFLQYDSYKMNPIEFLSSPSSIFPFGIMALVVIHLTYTIIDYFLWCKKCERSIAMGGTCINKTPKYKKILDGGLLTLEWLLLIGLLIEMVQSRNMIIVALGVIQVPIFMFVYSSSIKFLRRIKKSSAFNKVVSFIVLLIFTFIYSSVIILGIVKFDIPKYKGKEYRTVTWEMTSTETMDYKLYSDDLPLTCEELYGEIDYDYYSYEENIDSTIFLTRKQYTQEALPDKNSPPEIEYEILEPKFQFVKQLTIDHLKKTRTWSRSTVEKIDNNIFNTIEAYEFVYKNERYHKGEYILIYKDRIIFLTLEKPATEEEVAVIVDKLDLKENR